MNSLSSTLPPHARIISGHPTLGNKTKAQYIRAVDNLIGAGIDPRNPDQLASYAAPLPHSERAFLKAALRILFADTVTRLQASATPENIASVQAALLNIEAMSKTIAVKKHEGERVHFRLSQSQVDRLLSLPDRSTLRGMRDYVVLAVLVGAGLRREELAELTFDTLKRLPHGNTHRYVLEVTGKGEKTRVVPISPLLASRLQEWQATTGGGHVARAIHKTGTLQDSLSVVGIHDIVSRYGSRVDLPDLNPHDLRRTFGRLGWDATHDLILIRSLLGHKDAKTTQEYIGLNVRLDVTASDYIVREYQPSIGD